MLHARNSRKEYSREACGTGSTHDYKASLGTSHQLFLVEALERMRSIVSPGRKCVLRNIGKLLTMMDKITMYAHRGIPQSTEKPNTSIRHQHLGKHDEWTR